RGVELTPSTPAGRGVLACADPQERRAYCLRHAGSRACAGHQRRSGGEPRGCVHSRHGRHGVVSSVATMAHALLYLRGTSLAGRVKSRLRRLKQPKYLAGALVGAAYVYFSFVRRAHGPYSGHGSSPSVPGFSREVFAFCPELAALALLVILVVNWATPRQASLAFSEAEIAFLFPAPVNRRLLVHY